MNSPINSPGLKFSYKRLDTSGQVVDRSVNLDDNSLPLDSFENANQINDTDWVDTAMISGEHRLIYTVPVVDSSGAAGLLQISSSLTNHDLSLNYLARILIIGNLLVILAAIGIGWRLAGVGLRPIFDLAQVILSIGRTRDFAQRVNYQGTSDEIGQLANTFDLMLSELEDAYRQTEQALNTQKRFVADASHELRTPLTTDTR